MVEPMLPSYGKCLALDMYYFEHTIPDSPSRGLLHNAVADKPASGRAFAALKRRAPRFGVRRISYGKRRDGNGVDDSEDLVLTILSELGKELSVSPTTKQIREYSPLLQQSGRAFASQG